MSKARDLANIISGSGTLNANVIPDLAASKITSGTFADARISASSVNAHVDLSNLNASNLTSGTVASARLSLSASDVPDLAASKITSGTLSADRVPDLAASKVTSGSFDTARIPNLSAAKITSGTMDGSRISGGTFGSVNGSSLTNLPSSAPTNSQVLTGVASGQAGSVGGYCIFTVGSFGKGLNNTFSTNNAMFFCGINYNPGSGTQPSGTYRAMSRTASNSSFSNAVGLFLRIS